MSAEDLIDQYLAHCRLRGLSEAYTIYNWGRWLRRADRDLPNGLDQASEDEITSWLANPKWSRNTRYNYDTCLRRFYDWACREHDRWLELHPMEHIPRAKMPRGVPRPCTDDELTHILTHANEPYRTWAVLAAYAAARCIAIARLDREHVTEDGVWLYDKGDKPRVVPTHPMVWETMRDRPPGPIATGRGGRRLSGRDVSRNSIVHIHEVLKMPNMGLHRLRHWCLTRVQASTGDIRITQEIAGHDSPSTTARYTLVADAQRQAAIQALPVFTPNAESAESSDPGADAAPTPPQPPA